jgi:geranylgeranyl reductase family protein
MSAPLPVAGDAEIIVVGAGPAGASCAALLAEWGHDVLLLDQSGFPRDKPCGDGLTQSAVSALRRLDLDDLIASSMQVGGTRLYVDHKLFEQRRYDLTPRRPDRARCIRRQVLDDALLDSAVDRGARFLKARVLDRAGPPGSMGVEALVDSERCLLRSRFVIAADGATSRLRRTVVRPRLDDPLSAYAVRAYFRCEHPVEPVFSTYMPVEFEGKSLTGYGWVFPIDEQVLNVGVGYWRGPGIRFPAKIRDVLASFVERLSYPETSPFGELQQMSKLAGSPLGVQFRRDHCEADGIVFVGDAARTTDPWSGEGIAYAIHGAELIAKLVSARARLRGRPLDAGAVLGRRFGRLNYQMASQLRLLERRLSRAPLPAADRLHHPFLITLQHAIMAPDEAPSLLETPVGALARGDAAISSRLQCVNELLLDGLETAFPFAAEVFQAEIRAGLGPLSTIVLAAFDDSTHEDALLSAASAIELTTASAGPASEIVDRPRDDAARLNNALCVLMTDFALSRGARQAARVGTWLSRELVAVMQAICRTQVTASQQLFEPDRATEDYIEAAEARMAGPLALAARFAASTLDEGPDCVRRLDAFGRKLGLAAQVYEDTSELLHGIPLKGRDASTGLLMGAYCLPILYAAECDAALRDLLYEPVAQDALPAILRSTFETGAMARTLRLVTKSLEDANHLLEGLDGLCFERLRALALLMLEHAQTLLAEEDRAACAFDVDACASPDSEISRKQPVAS